MRHHSTQPSSPRITSFSWILILKLSLLAGFAYLFFNSSNLLSNTPAVYSPLHLSTSHHPKPDTPSTGGFDPAPKPKPSDPSSENPKPTKPTEPKPKPPEPSEEDPNKKPTTPVKEEPSLPPEPPITPSSKYQTIDGYIPDMSRFDNQVRGRHKVGLLELENTSAFLQKGGTVPNIPPKARLLCALKRNNYCRSNYIADVIDLLYAFAPIYGWQSQDSIRKLYSLHFDFVSYMKSIGVQVSVLEAIYPDQTFLATRPGREPWEIQIHVEDAFYYRENFLNVQARKVPGWEYLLWIDGHQIFENTYWWEDSIHKLEKFGTVQLFQYLYYMRNYNGTDMNVNFAGIQYAGYLTRPFFRYFEVPRGLWAGNAWGIRREVYNEIDYILDTCVAGWCDSAYNIPTFDPNEDWALLQFPHYKDQLWPWVEKASKAFKKHGIGPAIVRGNMVHFDHERFSKNEIERAQKAIGKGGYSFDDFYRDENYTLHTKEGSKMASLFTKKKWPKE